jgi:hypothetical protein
MMIWGLVFLGTYVATGIASWYVTRYYSNDIKVLTLATILMSLVMTLLTVVAIYGLITNSRGSVGGVVLVFFMWIGIYRIFRLRQEMASAGRAGS